MEEPRWRRYLRFRGPDAEADIEDELRFHLDMIEQELRAQGRSSDQARAEALARFGDLKAVRQWLQRHDGRSQHRKQVAEVIDEWVRDVRYGLRQLRQQPGFSAAVILVLALGIGATTAMFSAVDAVLLRPLPFAHADRLVRVGHVSIPFSYPGEESFPKAGLELTDLTELRDVFTGFAAYAPGGMNLSGAANPRRVRIGMVTPSFFSTLGVAPAIGRPFTLDEGRRGASRVAILSDALWRQHYGADPGAVTGGIPLNGRSYRVIGVMPRGFAFPAETDIWVPMPVPMTFQDWEPFRQSMQSTVVGRLAPGATVTQARLRVRTLLARYASPERMTEITAEELLEPLRRSLIGDRRTSLLVLFGATALVLLVACANVANLLLSRGAARRNEIAMRSVLGATPGRIARQLLVESMLFASIGGALGTLGALLGLRALKSLVPSGMAGVVPLGIDLRVLLFAIALVLSTGVVFGLWPAMAALRSKSSGMVRLGGTGSVGGDDRPHVRRLLVTGELALALMLLIGAGVMLRSLQTLLATELGVRPEQVVTAELSLSRASFGDIPERQQFVRAVLERLSGNPQIASGAMVNELPLRGGGGISLNVGAEGRWEVSPEDRVYAQDLRITPDYFRAMGIPILRGRSLSAGAGLEGAREIVINSELARILWPGEYALGQRLLLQQGAESYEVVGVVGNVSAGSLGDAPMPQMYFPLLKSPYPNLTIVARGAVPARQLSGWLREAVQSVAPGHPLYNVRTMQDVISSTVAPRRTNTLLITLFGLLGVLLAGLGVYGVIAYAVARRTREIGIRIALGAHPRRVVAQVMQEGLVLALIGTVVGIAGAWVLTQVLAGLVYGVSPRDPVAFLVAPAVLLAIAALASLMPARRAALIDPAAVMKAE